MADEAEGWATISVRVRPSELAAIDAVVDRRKQLGRATRASVLEVWIRRGLKEAERER
jgi:hypothetical protein